MPLDARLWAGLRGVGVANVKLQAKVSTIFDRFIDLLALLAVVILVLVWLSVFSEIVLRYFLDRPQIWVVETAEYSLLFITFLSAPWLLKGEGHVKIELVVDRLNPRKQALVNIVTSILGVVVCLAFLWWSGVATWNDIQTGVRDLRNLMLPRAPLIAVMPVASFALVIQFLRRGYG